MSDCALWYMRYYHAYYDLCASEEEAATDGVAMEDAEAGVVLGVQFPDGRIVKRGDWEAFHEARRRWDESWRAAEEQRKATPPPPSRKIKDPFEGREVSAPLDAPGWLGAS